MHVMDLWPESLDASGLGDSVFKWPMVKGGVERWLSMTYKVADAIACTSRSQVDLLARRGVPKSKLTYVPIWVDETVFRAMPRDEALAAELGVAGKTVLLYAGAIGEPQGLEVLIEACATLTDEPRLHCIIAGSGIAEERLRAMATRKKLTNVTFIGRWPIRDMTRLMSVGDVHLVSLRPNPLAQVAMPSKLPATLACGKPIIVAALGDAADVVRKADAGWTCLPGDVNQLAAAIRASVAAGETELAAIGRRARHAYEMEFAMSSVVGRLERLLSGRYIEDEDVA
jgi:glycosyltransferase involved in cell wall biosynthesis